MSPNVEGVTTLELDFGASRGEVNGGSFLGE